MADYGSQQGRSNGRQPNVGQAPPDLRDAAFSSIFGAAPPPGRSQTMPSPPQNNRTQTMSSMSSQASGMSSRAPPIRQPYPQPQPQPQGYFNQAPNGYQQQQQQQQQQQANNNPSMQTSATPQQPQPQYLPQPVNPDRRPYPPQRVDPRAPQVPAHYNRNLPQRGYPPIPAPPPALNSSAFRTQSLATLARPSYQAANSYSASSANNFRQLPYVNRTSHTTAQGRIVPERHDERSMSMSAFARDGEHSQILSGRVIPQKQREPSIQETEIRPSIESNASSQTYAQHQTHQPGAKTRTSSIDTQSTRTMSMASTIAPSIAPSETSQSTAYRPAMSSNRSGSSSQMTAIPRRRAPVVYGAMLSNVADAFKERMGISDRTKNGVLYKNAFTGSEAVDLLCYIVQTPDRNLALLLGRTLDGKSQRLFHDVDYMCRLRDSPDELYQFREIFSDGETFNEEDSINGVFNLLTSCYSPTCTSENLCYSISCPNRTDQQKHLNMRVQSALKREVSRISLQEDIERTDEQRLWINMVPKAISDITSEREKKRQEVICELCYTERDFCKDLDYLNNAWMRPLKGELSLRGRSNPSRPSPIPEHRRKKFVEAVFSNCQDILAVNNLFSKKLSDRQKQEHVMRNVGDFFLEFIPLFGPPFITYGANQMFGKYEYEKERGSNPAFARFADEVERQPESRKLELNGYLTKPTTRLARYPLLLENILKYTAEDNPDFTDIPKAIAGIKNILSKVNIESGKSENRFNLVMLDKNLIWRPGEYVDLHLSAPTRQLLFKGPLRKSPTDASSEITAYLFDHALLFARAKLVNKREELKVWKRPIQLGLLVMTSPDDYNPKMGLAKRPSSSLISSTRSTTSMAPRSEPNRQAGYPITFRDLGKGGFEQILYCTSQVQRQKWFEHVDAQQNAVKRARSNIFTKTILNEGFFSSVGMRINCCVPIDGGRKLVVGTDVGVYITDRKPKDASTKPKRVLDVKNVTQIDVLEQHNILLVMSDKTLFSYAIEALDPEESVNAQSKRGRKIGHANFFKVGIFEGQHLVCSVKPPGLAGASDIKIYKPESMPSGKKKSGLAKMLAGGQEVLKPYKEFYIPTETYSVHFLKSTLCVGCARGYEIVELASLITQPLLDQADTSLDFVVQRENLKPLHVERISGKDFLLCYSEFSFFVDRLGWRAFPDWKINWEGNPQSFAVFQPYILAFEPSFIEMRHLETGFQVYILTAKNIRMLHSSTREILYAYEDETGEDVIASLDFWGRPQDGARMGVEKTER